MIGRHLVIDTGLSRQVCIRTPHHLKVGPAEPNLREPRVNVPPPEIVPTHGRFEVLGRKTSGSDSGRAAMFAKPRCLRLWRPTALPPAPTSWFLEYPFRLGRRAPRL